MSVTDDVLGILAPRARATFSEAEGVPLAESGVSRSMGVEVIVAVARIWPPDLGGSLAVLRRGGVALRLDNWFCLNFVQRRNPSCERRGLREG